MMKAVAVVSGGMDSVVLAHLIKDGGHDLTMISFDYGQRHRKELGFASLAAQRLNVDHHIVNMQSMIGLISKSALTNDSISVPDGHYAEQTMKQTVVPNRNAIMLNIAAGLAITVGADRLATGVHAGDHYIYPDCRPEFIRSLEEMLKIANEGFIDPDFKIYAPFVDVDKARIAQIGHELNVPWIETWSCYKGGEIHCGACGTCFERREAFRDAGVEDPTIYAATPEYADPR
jgi:7-cyano-7-deazaguanine synthase